MFKGFAVLVNMTAACMDVSEVEHPALLAAKICGGSIGGSLMSFLEPWEIFGGGNLPKIATRLSV